MRVTAKRAVLAAALLMLAGSPVFAADPKFLTDGKDIPAWAADPVENVVRWEIMRGYPVQGKPEWWGEFRPNGTISRAEFAAILSRALDENGAGAPQGGFRDVPATAWYAANVNGLVQAGIIRVGDYGLAVLRPDEPITRAELATWVGRAAAREKIQPAQADPGLTDLAAEKYRDEIVLAARTGIVRGFEDRTFRPKATATRAEAATMIHRLVSQMTSGAPEVKDLERLDAEGMAIMTWAEKQHDQRLATKEGLAPHLERYDTPIMLALDADDQRFFLGNPVWYSEKRHIEVQPVFMGRTVAITVGGSMHRTKLDNGAWEVDPGWSYRGHYLWWLKVNGQWKVSGGKVYQTKPDSTEWELPPFYQPIKYNQGNRPANVGESTCCWGEDGVMIYDPGADPPQTARFGITNAQSVVERWEPSIQP